MRASALPLLLALVLASGCIARVAPIPDIARDQVRHTPPSSGWFGQGRLALAAPGHHISCTVLLRGLGDGRIRMVLLSDEGIQLIDMTVSDAGTTITACLTELRPLVPVIARLVFQAYGNPPEGPMHRDHGRQVVASGKELRIYSGDPVALRAVVGRALDLEIGDYLIFDHDLLPQTVREQAPLDIFTVTLHLEGSSVRHLAGPTAAPTP